MKKTNEQLLTSGSRIALKKKRQKKQQVAEIRWDDDARREYLTGFQKRKQQRREHAIKLAKERERQERIEARRMKREAAAAMLQAAREQVKVIERGAVDSSDEENGAGEDQANKNDVKTFHSYTTVTTVTTMDLFGEEEEKPIQ